MNNLEQELEQRYSPLLQEKEHLEIQLASLENDLSFKREIAQLQARVERSKREITDLLAEGKFEEAGQKESEQRELKGRIHDLTSQRNVEIETIRQRLNFIVREKQNIAEKVLKEGFASLQKEGWNRLEEVVDFIETGYREIEGFVQKTGSGNAGVGIYALKVYPHDPTRSLWLKLRKFVHMGEA